MSPIRITDIWCRLPLAGSELTQIVVEAIQMASDPECSILDCPWGSSRDRMIRAQRIAWRLAFRCMRERGKVRFTTTVSRQAA
jgi:hypothetical protein